MGSFVRVVAVVGRHGTGKTALIERLVGRLSPSGPVAVVKHSHHPGLRWDAEGSDTARSFAAGASIVVGAGPDHVVVHSRRNARLIELIEQISREAPTVRYVVVEGFHRELAALPACEIVLRVRDAADLSELTGEGGFVPWAIVPAFPDGVRGDVPGIQDADGVIARLVEELARG
jgi:molybdopterin-guanine dinucleotide biosynthesis protein MobB